MNGNGKSDQAALVHAVHPGILPIRLAVENVELEGAVIEAAFLPSQRVWKYDRLRVDKPHANHRSVVDGIVKNLDSPVSCELVC